MVRLSYVALVSGVILSFHDTYWQWAFWFVVAWATLASLEVRFNNKNFF
jgi:hypothetical protein